MSWPGWMSHTSTAELFDIHSSYPGSCSIGVSSPTSYVPRPNRLQIPWDCAHCSSRPRRSHHRLRVAEEVIPLYLKLRCSQLLIRAMTCGSKPTRSSVRRRLRRQAMVSSVAAAGFVEKDPESEPDWVKGSCAVSAARLKEGSTDITRHPSAQSQQSIADKYIPSGKELYLPKPPPALQTSPPDPPKKRILKPPP